MSQRVLGCKSWTDKWPLHPFMEKLHELESSTQKLEGKKSILMQTRFRCSYYTILITYTWIKCILERIDEDLRKDLDFLDTLDLVEKGVHVTAPELPPSNPYLTHVDIVSFILFSNILMDDIARFLGFLFWGESKPKTRSFGELKDTIGNFQGLGLEELRRIISNTCWFEEMKELRDKPIVHKGEKDGSIGRSGQNIGIWLRYVDNRKIKEKFVSNNEIDKLCNNIYDFLESLNAFLCEMINLLPIKTDLLYQREAN